MWLVDWMLKMVRLTDFGSEDEDEYNEDDGYDGSEEDYKPNWRDSARKDTLHRTSMQGRRKNAPCMEVCMIRPDEFNECQEAAGFLLAGRVVILDLAKLGRGPAQRVIDFVSGTVYAIDGDFKQISQDVFIASPASADLTGEFEDLVKSKAQDTSWIGGIRGLVTA